MSVDDIEQSAFEAAQRFEVVLPWSQVHAWEPGHNQTACGLPLRRSQLRSFPHLRWPEVQPATGGAADGVNRVLPEVLSRAGCPAGTTGRWRWRFP